jgi:hypothetical protein
MDLWFAKIGPQEKQPHKFGTRVFCALRIPGSGARCEDRRKLSWDDYNPAHVRSRIVLERFPVMASLPAPRLRGSARGLSADLHIDFSLSPQR